MIRPRLLVNNSSLHGSFVSTLREQSQPRGLKAKLVLSDFLVAFDSPPNVFDLQVWKTPRQAGQCEEERCGNHWMKIRSGGAAYGFPK
jgi:hypothetical protein